MYYRNEVNQIREAFEDKPKVAEETITASNSGLSAGLFIVFIVILFLLYLAYRYRKEIGDSIINLVPFNY